MYPISEREKGTVYNCYDKRQDDIEFRFVIKEGKEWSPFCDRFPKAEWMEW